MKKILLVEDEQQYRKVLRKKLEGEGFSVFEAIDGQQALEIVAREEIDLILLDLVMPKMGGVDFYSHLTSRLKKNIPTIILTNLDYAAYPTGVKDYLIKTNTSLEEIIKKIKQYLA